MNLVLQGRCQLLREVRRLGAISKYKEIDVTETPFFIKEYVKIKTCKNKKLLVWSGISPSGSSGLWTSSFWLSNKVPKTYLFWVLPSSFWLSNEALSISINSRFKRKTWLIREFFNQVWASKSFPPLSKRRYQSYVLVFISWLMVLLPLVERGISMIVVRRSISTIGRSGRGLSISVLRRGISIAERSISTIGSSGKSISISIAGRSLPKAMVSISTIEGTGRNISTSWKVISISIAGRCISTGVVSGDDP